MKKLVLLIILTIFIIFSTSLVAYAGSIDLIKELKPFKREKYRDVKISGIIYKDALDLGDYSIYWFLDGKFNELFFTTGCPDNRPRIREIIVHGDDKQIVKFGELTPADGVKEFQVNVKDVKVLQIEGSSIYTPIINISATYDGELSLNRDGVIPINCPVPDGDDLVFDKPPFEGGTPLKSVKFFGSTFDHVIRIYKDAYWNLGAKYSTLTFWTGCNDVIYSQKEIIVRGDGIVKGEIVPTMEQKDGLRICEYDVSGVNILQISGGYGCHIINPRASPPQIVKSSVSSKPPKTEKPQKTEGPKPEVETGSSSLGHDSFITIIIENFTFIKVSASVGFGFTLVLLLKKFKK